MEVVTYCCVLYMTMPGCVSAHHQQTCLFGVFFFILLADRHNANHVFIINFEIEGAA